MRENNTHSEYCLYGIENRVNYDYLKYLGCWKNPKYAFL